ncbi:MULTISPECIES: hypothetical protein [unclassified Crossiella]|uniref:hypothetical protein n=1 Tax=unclassified Crossiella TaxID=2620835 RepID=UPI001FFE69A6|nr:MULTISPECIES: hypothetical protein [unclassified Crossiella]MCK2245429.1 hypothetical protein [Crossiella sp. S99.2]MCK2259081.1 hypothetical protein [Crossiella sp. S99.1]
MRANDPREDSDSPATEVFTDRVILAAATLYAIATERDQTTVAELAELDLREPIRRLETMDVSAALAAVDLPPEGDLVGDHQLNLFQMSSAPQEKREAWHQQMARATAEMFIIHMHLAARTTAAYGRAETEDDAGSPEGAAALGLRLPECIGLSAQWLLVPELAILLTAVPGVTGQVAVGRGEEPEWAQAWRQSGQVAEDLAHSYDAAFGRPPRPLTGRSALRLARLLAYVMVREAVTPTPSRLLALALDPEVLARQAWHEYLAVRLPLLGHPLDGSAPAGDEVVGWWRHLAQVHRTGPFTRIPLWSVLPDNLVAILHRILLAQRGGHPLYAEVIVQTGALAGRTVGILQPHWDRTTDRQDLLTGAPARYSVYAITPDGELPDDAVVEATDLPTPPPPAPAPQPPHTAIPTPESSAHGD